MQSYIANPVSRNNLRELAYTIRCNTKTENEFYFPVLEFIEIVLPEILNGFNYEILPEKLMGNHHGLTQPDKKLIKLREDVYIRALNGEGRDRLTCAHEVGHLFLHNKYSIQLARIGKGEKIKTYIDPEWQANAFAGELLVPAHLVKGLSAEEISSLCGVSLPAAQKQLSSIIKNK
ncbi:UNVERIFIED_CONTAM: Zn-dependent peptidase ImmA (M78 family) [Acetivibrio alkalicellulosi]